MAEVTVFTAARMKQIEDSAIIGGSVDANGDLILVTRAGTKINAGTVKGAKGDPGPAGASVAVGSVIDFAGPQSKIPTGYLLALGQAVSRTTYADLFAVLGTQHGSGNGSTTFNLPNLSERVVAGVASGNDTAQLGLAVGAASKMLGSSELPAHTHVMDHGHGGSATTSQNSHSHEFDRRSTTGSLSGLAQGGGTLNSTRGNTYGNDHTHTVTIPSFTGSTGAAYSGTQVALSLMQPTEYLNKLIKF